MTAGMRLSDPTVTAIAQRHKKSSAQIFLRWSIQHGDVVLPKSVKKERIDSNFSAQGWHIDSTDMQRLDGLNKGVVTDWDLLDVD